MLTVQQVKNGETLPKPIYKNEPYIIIGKQNNVVASGKLLDIMNAWSYYDDCFCDIRRYDLYSSSAHINDLL
jgi:hypothetical protein